MKLNDQKPVEVRKAADQLMLHQCSDKQAGDKILMKVNNL